MQSSHELDQAIDAIVASYAGSAPINNLQSAALPNKRRVIDGFRELKALLFLGFYSTPALRPEQLPDVIRERVDLVHQLWCEPVDRALRYAHWTGRKSAKTAPDEANRCDEGERLLLQLLQTLPAIRTALATDVQAAYDGDPAAESVEEIIFSYPSVEAIAAYRVAHELRRAGVPMIPRIITEHAHSVTGIDIHPGAKIGNHFFIDHGTGVVIGESSVIGEHVKLYQGVTLGALSIPNRDANADKRHPTLEDRVTLYAGATILGGATIIGHDSVVGGNVCLVDSVPPYSRIVGRSRDANPFTQPPPEPGDSWG